MTFAVPNGLGLDSAALTEPWRWPSLHAVRAVRSPKRDTAVVVGCGPVGLWVVCQLKGHGVEKIVASDSRPGDACWHSGAAPRSSST